MDSIGILRNIRNSELDMILTWRNAPNVRANMYTTHIIDAEEHHQWWLNVQSREDQHYFMYETAGEPTGIVAFNGIDKKNNNSSWAFYASPDAPKGSGTKMEFLALSYAFTDLCLHKLHCEVLAFNASVIKLHQKFGFKVEGVLREHYKVDGTFIDIYQLGLLASEWSDQRQKMETKIAKFS